MTEGIVVALITGVLTLAGVIVTTVYGNKKTTKTVKAQGDLTLYRIEQLEKKQDTHNQLIERTYILEGQVAELTHDVRDLKAYHKPQ